MAESIAEFFSEHFHAHRQERAYRQRRGYRTESFTYGEVMSMAAGFAAKLDARGIAKGERVMLWGENCAEWVAAFFGCALRGVIVVPMDDVAAADFAMRVFQQVSAKLLVGSRRHLLEVAAAGHSIASMNLERSGAGGEFSAGQSATGRAGPRRRPANCFHFGHDCRAQGRGHHERERAGEHRAAGARDTALPEV